VVSDEVSSSTEDFESVMLGGLFFCAILDLVLRRLFPLMGSGGDFYTPRTAGSHPQSLIIASINGIFQRGIPSQP
jgi:hypothetical protein